MKLRHIILIISLTCLVPLTASYAATPHIVGPEMKIKDNNIIVSLSIDNIMELEKTIRSGVEKEIVYTIELLRVLKFWPDEFVVSKKVKKVIKYDNLRELYLASSYNGIERVTKNFKDFPSMREWMFTVNTVNLANVRELEPSNYCIRIVVESKSREQLPLIGFLMHFIPEVEMSLAKESRPFTVKDNL